MARKRKDTKLPDTVISWDPLVNWSHVIYDAEHGDPRPAFENTIAAIRYEVGDDIDPWPFVLEVTKRFKNRFPNEGETVKQLKSIAKRYLKKIKLVRKAGCFTSMQNDECEELEVNASCVADEADHLLERLRRAAGIPEPVNGIFNE